MTKTDYSIRLATKAECKSLLDKYHYLSKESKGFKSGYNFALIRKKHIVGVCIFTIIPTPELAVKYGYSRQEQHGLFELSRLCLKPSIQRVEHNIASWFVSRSIKWLKRLTKTKLIISYADSRYHKGTVYRALNFKYDGLSAKKKDFYRKLEDGSYHKVSRGKVKHLEGEWRERPIKHRFVMHTK